MGEEDLFLPSNVECRIKEEQRKDPTLHAAIAACEVSKGKCSQEFCLDQCGLLM